MSLSSRDFPRLDHLNHRVTSPPTPDYNCIAWSAGETTRWWQPGSFWPVESPPDDYGIGILEQAFRTLGFEDCENDEQLEPGYEKVALYGSMLFYTHAARQLPDGRWTSKLGRSEDIEHDSPQAVAGGVYGELLQIMKRRAPITEEPRP